MRSQAGPPTLPGHWRTQARPLPGPLSLTSWGCLRHLPTGRRQQNSFPRPGGPCAPAQGPARVVPAPSVSLPLLAVLMEVGVGPLGDILVSETPELVHLQALAPLRPPGQAPDSHIT